MRALLRFIAIVATTLAIGLGASAAFSGAPALTDQQKLWLAFHVPHLAPPPLISCLDHFESGNDYAFPLDGRPPNGYEGAGQWLHSTWSAAAQRSGWGVFASWPVGAVPAGVQDQVMWYWGTHDGWGQWGTHWRCGV